MAEATRKTVVAVVPEVTSGTPVAPTSGSQYVPVLGDFDFSPEIEEIENEELSSSVGVRAPILGLESPTAELPYYVRHSGVEATAPSNAPLLKAAFGDQVAAPTEQTTAAASTAGTSTAAAIVKLVSSTGLERGSCILIKDPVNGYSARNVQSVSGNDLTLGFNLAAAPGSGVNVGRPILFKPSDTPPPYSLWGFRSQGGNIELVAGAKCSELSIEAVVNQPLKGSASFEGTSFYFDPIAITATDTKLDFNETGPNLRAATIAAKMYKDPHELAEAIQNAMNDVATDTITVSYSNTTGKFTIATNGSLLELLWSTGANTANTIGDKIGFVVASDDTGALTYTSDNAQSWASYQTPTSDSNIQPLIVKNSELMIGSFYDYGCAGARSFTFTIGNEQVDVTDICAESGLAEKLLSQRAGSIESVFTLSKHHAEYFKRFRKGDDIRFAANIGVKSGTNWVAGRLFNLYIPQAKISAFKVSDQDSTSVFEMTMVPYVGSDGLGEMYANYV